MLELLSNPIDALLDFALIVTCCMVPVVLGLGAGFVHHALDKKWRTLKRL